MQAFEPPPSNERRFDADALVIRDAEKRDFEALLGIWREMMDHHFLLDRRFELSSDAEERFIDYVETAKGREDYRVRFATVDGQPAGFSVACVLPNNPIYRARWVGYINDLCVTRHLRRQGLGHALVRDAVRWLRATGAESVEVYVAHGNQTAQRFWRQVGGRDYLDRLSLDLQNHFER